MGKNEIKKKLLEAIENDPHKKDIKKVSIFGSYAYGRPGKRSDVDVLIEFTPEAKIGLLELAAIKDNMKKFIRKKVDLVPRDSLHKFIKQEILSNAKKIYQKR